MRKTCSDCGAKTVSSVEAYDDSTLVGLPVSLEGVTIYRCRSCDTEAVRIPAQTALGRTIAHGVARKPDRLAPEEVRFLRSWLGQTIEELAELMGVTPSQVSRWQTGAKQIGIVSERLLRSVALNEAPLDLLRSLSKERLPAAPLEHHLFHDGKGWRRRMASAA